MGLTRFHFPEKPYRPGQQLWHRTVNKLMENQEDLSAVGVGTGAQGLFTGAGSSTRVVPGSEVVVFQLYDSLQMPDASRSEGSEDEPDVPWTEGARLLFYHSQDYVYKLRTNNPNPETIYFPLCYRNDDGIAIGVPGFVVGDRVWCVLNRQSGRWESLEHAGRGPWWGKLDGALSAGGSATVSIWAGATLADTGTNVTAYDWLLGVGDSLALGTKVLITFISGKWYVTQAAC